jgi:hypothetical protein
LPEVPKPGRFARELISRAARPKEAAQDIIRNVSLSPSLIDHLAASNPYLGLSLIQVESSWAVRELAERYAAALLEDPQSAFYRELRRAENVDADSVPLVDSIDQPLLSTLVADSCREDGPRLLYTFLEAGINPIRYGRFPQLLETLSGPIADFHDRGRWRCPPFAAIYLVAIVAPVNAVDPKAQMLNLYVLDTLAGDLLDSFPDDCELDSTDERPTPTHHLLYEIVSTLRDVVRVWKQRPAGLKRVEEEARHSDTPRHLPEHAADVLGAVMSRCFRSEKLGGPFKGYLLQVWWSIYWDRYKGKWEYSEAVLDSLINSGRIGTDDTMHVYGLRTALEHIDLVDRISEGADLLRARSGIPRE